MIIELKAELAVREGSSSGEHLTNPGEVEACLGDLKDLAQEAFCTITLNTKNRLIKRHLPPVCQFNRREGQFGIAEDIENRTTRRSHQPRLGEQSFFFIG